MRRTSVLPLLNVAAAPRRLARIVIAGTGHPEADRSGAERTGGARRAGRSARQLEAAVRPPLLCQLMCRVGGDVGGSQVLEAHLEGASGQLSDPRGVCSLRPAHPPTLRRVRCQPTGLAAGAAATHTQTRTRRELARIWTAGPRTSHKRKRPKSRDFGFVAYATSPNPLSWSGAESNCRHHDFQVRGMTRTGRIAAN
jgi:hypothetical protein